MEDGNSFPGNLLAPVNLGRWLNEHGNTLEPPVGAGLLHRSEEFFVMIIKGPNRRNDYHINPGNEWFYQISGQLLLHIIDEQVFDEKTIPSCSKSSRQIVINEGEAFMLPSRVPHCPVRMTGTIGLVLERIRTPNESDTLCWYCDVCKELVHMVTIHCPDHQLGSVFAPLMQSYYNSQELRTCKKCHHINSVPS
jgi:3-hydroxyanthranilate 3,4-dioxygenase